MMYTDMLYEKIYKCFYGMLGIKSVEKDILEQVAKILKGSTEAIENFDEEKEMIEKLEQFIKKQ